MATASASERPLVYRYRHFELAPRDVVARTKYTSIASRAIGSAIETPGEVVPRPGGPM